MKKFLSILGILISSIIIISIITALIFFLIYLSNVKTIDLFWFWILLIYILICGLAFSLRVLINKKLIKVIADFVLSPIYILLAICMIIFPFLKLITHYIIAFWISYLIPYLTLKILFYYNVLVIPDELKLYIILTTIVFLVVLLNKVFQNITNSLLQLIGKPKRLDEIFIGHVATQNNMKFFIYAGYVILVIMINICKLQETTLFGNVNCDTAVIQSFVTFLAFDKALGLGQQIKFSGWKTVLAYINDIQSFMATNKDQQKK